MPITKRIPDYASITTAEDVDYLDVSKEGGSAFTEPTGGSRKWSIADLKLQMEDELTFDNFYTVDGTLSSTRTVTMGANKLSFMGAQTGFGIAVPVSWVHIQSNPETQPLTVGTTVLPTMFNVHNSGNMGMGTVGDATNSFATDSRLRISSVNRGGTAVAISQSGFVGESIGINTVVSGGASGEAIGLKTVANNGSNSRAIQGIAQSSASSYNIGIEGTSRNGTSYSIGGNFTAGAGAGTESVSGVIGVWSTVQGGPNLKKTAFKATFGDNTAAATNVGFDIDLTVTMGSKSIGLDIACSGSTFNAAIYVRSGDIYFLGLANTGVADRLWNNGTDNIVRIGP